MRLSATRRGTISTGRGLGDRLYDLAGAPPSLDLRFADQKALDSRISFTRASTATYVGSDGLIKTAAVNEPRFDHNPTTGESLGLLVEELRANLLTYSEDFGNAAFSTSGATISTNTANAPDGTTTADTVSSTGTATVSQPCTKTALSITYTTSLFVKGTVTALNLTIDDGATVNRGRCIFNLATGTLTSAINDGTFTGTSASITPFINGWYRLTVTTTTTSVTTTIRFRFFWTGSGTSIDVWGAQLEEGFFATSYIPTTTAATHAADVAQITGTNFSSWYRQDEGTVLFDGINPATSTTGYSISDGSTNNRIQMDTGTNTRVARIVSAGVAQANNNIAYTYGTAQKFTLSYAANSINFANAGVLGTEDTSATIPTVDQVKIGTNPTGVNPLNSTVRRFTYWPQRLSNSTLQSLAS